MTTPLTIYRFGLCGNSANESIGKHRFRTKKRQKVNKSSQNTTPNRFGYWRPWVRVPPLRPKRKSIPCGCSFFLSVAARPRARICAKRRMRVRISRSEIDKLACQAQSADIFTFGENPAITYSIPPRFSDGSIL